jgi:hypothetical protein
MNEENGERLSFTDLLAILKDDQISLRVLAERALLLIERREHGITRLGMAYMLAILLFEDHPSWHLDFHIRMTAIFVLWWLFIKGRTTLAETIVLDTCIRLFNKHISLPQQQQQQQHRNNYNGSEMAIDKVHEWDAKCLIICLQQGDKVGFELDMTANGCLYRLFFRYSNRFPR